MSSLKKSSLKSINNKKQKPRIQFSDKNHILVFEKIDPNLKHILWWSCYDQYKARNEYLFELLKLNTFSHFSSQGKITS